MKTFFLEGYGCSLNVSETEQISGFLKQNGFFRVNDFSDSDYVIINTCSVKMVTEQRMVSRIKFLLENKKQGSLLIVVGCLAKTNNSFLKKISGEIIVLDTKLESLSSVLGLQKKSFSPKLVHEKTREGVTIIPVGVGCVGECAYCATRLARGKLCSYPISEINNAFKLALRDSKEIWLTSQDLGCYGFDLGVTLPDLLKVLLKNKGEFRVRLGMMHPRHFKKIGAELVKLFGDDRLYKFLHLPIQSGSDKILKKMNRCSTKKDFVDAVNYVRKRVPSIRISTDIIVGFPSETKKDFKESIAVIKKTRPSVVNISRFGKRFGTPAFSFPNQVSEQEKKERSSLLTKTIKQLFLSENKKKVGETEFVLVSEKAKKNGFVARTNNYSPVLVDSRFNEFSSVIITRALPNFFEGKFLEK